MERNGFRQILIEQKEELQFDDETSLVYRDKESDIDTQSNLAQIITGIRRCGKSTLAQMALRKLNCAFVNFDDERLYNLQAEDLNHLLEALYGVYGEFEYLLLDEIQNVDGWHLFVNRLLRNKIRIVLTGSNSKLLSREMASHLTGRYSSIELFPFSFGEYLEAKKQGPITLNTAKGKGLVMNLFMEYLINGGFPEVVRGENRKNYVSNLFDAIVSRDIIFRYKIRHERTFREISLWLAGNYGAEISYNRIKNTFNLGSENTAKNYVSYLEEAWLFISLSKFSFKKQESLRNRKIYLIDTSFADLAGESGSQNTGRLLENVVMLHLLRHRLRNGYEVFYYKKTVEVDFLIYRQRTVHELIQVSLSIENKKTRDREIRALFVANSELKATKLTIITMNEEEQIEQDEKIINVVPVVSWLLQDVIL